MRFLLLVLLFFVLLPRTAIAQCVNPAGNEGDVVYNETYNVPQYCDNNDTWIAMAGAAPTGPVGCPEVGDTCSDGTIYAGMSPDGDVPMYAAQEDAPSLLPWNDGSSNWVDTALENCTGNSPGSQESCRTGQANTALLVGLRGSGSPAPYEAAEYCGWLAAHGYSDWYLPAQDELNVLYNNKNAGDLDGSFNESGDWPAGWYWSSSERSDDIARRQVFSDGNQPAIFTGGPQAA